MYIVDHADDPAPLLALFLRRASPAKSFASALSPGQYALASDRDTMTTAASRSPVERVEASPVDEFDA